MRWAFVDSWRADSPCLRMARSRNYPMLQKSFCTRDQNFFWLYRRLPCKYVGTSSSEEKLAGDPGNVIEATSIGGRRSDFFTAGKLAAGNFGLLQQYLPLAAVSNRREAAPYSITSSATSSRSRG